MKERPILFSAPMVRALLEGRKTQTRRIIKPQPQVTERHLLDTGGWVQGMTLSEQVNAAWQSGFVDVKCPHGQPGQKLWVKHSFDCFPVYYRPIKFGDGKYAVGTDGVLYNIAGDAPRRVATRLTEKGYSEINLRYKGQRKPIRVNRLVAEAFYGEAPHELPICRHLDGNSQNNKPENLDWGTSAQNTADAQALGKWNGEANGSATLTRVQVEEIRRSTEPQSVLAVRFGVTQPTISKIKNKKRWNGDLCPAPQRNIPEWKPWKSPIFCPRWASRILLEITEVRVERLQDISEADARAEGCVAIEGMEWHTFEEADAGIPMHPHTAIDAYAGLWESINGDGSWDANPWVWVISFKRIESK